MDDKAELVAFARESAKAGVDLYDLLGVDGSTSRDDIHRAWRRKGLKYHPDKAGDNYDPTIYERFMRARDVLVDEDVRKVYDTGRAAEAQRKMASEQMSSERRRFKDELEAAEKAHGATSTNLTPFGAPSTTSAPESSEHDKLREAGRRRAEERTRREQEAKDQARQREDDRILEIERRLRDKVEKAKRRAEKKQADEPTPTPAPASAATSTSAPKPPAASVESEWKRLVQKGMSKTDSDKPGVDRNSKLFAETMARLTAAGRAQRQREKDAAAGKKSAAPTPPAPPPAVPLETDVTDETTETVEAMEITEPAEDTPVLANPRAAELRTTVEPVSDIGDNNSVVELFEPQWEVVDDPEVSQFINRVPKFDSASTAGDVPMETVG